MSCFISDLPFRFERVQINNELTNDKYTWFYCVNFVMCAQTSQLGYRK